MDCRTNDSPGVETVTNLVAKISSIHAQRWRYKHLVHSPNLPSDRAPWCALSSA